MELERSPLLTDLYELTMLQTYYEHGMEQQAVFELFLRHSAHRPHFLVAGIEQALDWLEQLRFSDAEIGWLDDSGLFRSAFLERLREFRFTGEVRALPEGTICFAEEPMVQVIAPLPEAQLIESRLMNIIHFQTLIATKAARCVHAADGRRVVDFGLRRAHGGEAGLWAARACYLAGFGATATALAGARYGIPVTGTMAHSFILAHNDEATAFERFARSHPDNVILLIDTFDVAEGARKAVRLGQRLQSEGIPLRGVRIDSGDLTANAREVRAILDAGGLPDTLVLVSGGLDEHRIAAIVADGAPVDGFGVGSKVNTSADEPFFDSAYKLHQLDGGARAKHSEGKTDLPGLKQIYRQYETSGRFQRDVVGLAEEGCEGTPLLTTVMHGGQRRDGPSPETLEQARERARRERATLPDGYGPLSDADDRHAITLSPGLRALVART